MSFYNMNVLEDKSNRLAFYFPDDEQRAICTNGLSKKPLNGWTNADVHKGGEEGVTAFNVLTHITNPDTQNKVEVLSSFIDRLVAIREQRILYKGKEYDVDAGGVNSRGERYPDFAGRVADRLVTQARENFAGSLTQELMEKIDVAYAYFKEDIDSRSKRHGRDTEQFNEIFAAEKYAEVRRALLHPVAGHLTPKHIGFFLAEVHGNDKREELVKLFFEAVTASPNNQMAKHLVDWYEKNMKKYSVTYNHELPPSLAAINEAGIARFREVQPKK